MHKFRTGNELRTLFLKYFEEQKHMIESSASLVPINDPTLLWINSGVAALKKYFDGSQIPNNPRIANSQKAIRTNDIENVGFTARHHTFFEMLGNFSIGDYFRKEAIEFAWQFLSDPNWVGLDKDKLYVTIHPDDQESYDVWHNVIGLSGDRIFKIDGNFWQIGEGPCGPNTEIFYDRGSKYDPEGLGLELLARDLENDRYIEIWNVVLSQYNAIDGVKRENYLELPQKNIDTGMGLERLACVVQETESNFETDLFLPIIQEVEKLSTISYEDNKIAYRVIADHIRTIVFAVNDGALFSNEGRGYVLRRLLRRASRYARELEIFEPFMSQLVDLVVTMMAEHYDFDEKQITLIKRLIQSEEKQFVKTLQVGLKHLEDIISNLKTKTIDGKQAFLLYDTYGFPLELTVELCQKYDIEVDVVAFEREMTKQKERARNARKDDESMAKQSKDLLEFETTSTFIGYDDYECETSICAIFENGILVKQSSGILNIVLEKTPFYAESGGEVADSGYLVIDDVKFEVLNVTKLPKGQHVHQINTMGTFISVNDVVIAHIDKVKRLSIQKNHTAAHLFFALLRKHLGEHVNQAGSYVDDMVMRFDFTHYEKVDQETLLLIESELNDIIANAVPLVIEYMSNKEAQALGAVAQFDEKYGEVVRVVTIQDQTIDLCGGCHVKNTADIGIFKIESESSVGSGIRRVSALTGRNVYHYLNEKLKFIHDVAINLKVNNEAQIIDRIISNDQKMLSSELQLNELSEKMNEFEINNLVNESIIINNHRVLVFEKTGIDQNTLKKLLVNFAEKQQDLIIVALLNTNNEQIVFSAVGQKVLTDLVNSQTIIKAINDEFDGKGGGKRHLAQAKIGKKIDISNILRLLTDKFLN